MTATRFPARCGHRCIDFGVPTRKTRGKPNTLWRLPSGTCRYGRRRLHRRARLGSKE